MFLTNDARSSWRCVATPSNQCVQSRLAAYFPTLGKNPRNRRSASKRKASHSPQGRPSKALVHKDLIVIPCPSTDKVPTHASRVELEERQLVRHQFPFNRSWDAEVLKATILKEFPRLLMFEYVKVRSQMNETCL